MFRNLILAILLAASTPLIGAPHAAADFVNRKERASGSVTACSNYGRWECYQAPVRRGKFGAEMRLRGGTWVDCEGDCRDTLRRLTVDYWDDQAERSGDN